MQMLLQKENAQLREGLDKVVNEYERLDQNYRAAQQKIEQKGQGNAKN